MEPSEKKRAEQKTLLIEYLRRIPIFSALSDSTLRKILPLCSKLELDEGEVLCREGETSEELYILLMGKLLVQLKESKTIATIEPGKSVGEMGVFTGKERCATVIAGEKSRLLCLKKAHLDIIIRREPESGVKIMYNVIKLLSEFILADNIRMQEYINYIDSLGKGERTKTDNNNVGFLK